MTISGDDFPPSRNGAWRPRDNNIPPRNTERRAAEVQRRADAMYEHEYRLRVNPETRETAEYITCLEDAERETPFEATPYREGDLRAAGYRQQAEYRYTDVRGGLLYFVWRYEHDHVAGAKIFRQGRYDENSPTGIAADAGKIKVPFRWPELAAADPTALVFWCEGEKDVDTCIQHGLAATTAAGQNLSPIIAKALAGRDVVVLVDKDAKGEENAANAIAYFRHDAGSVRVVRLPRLRRREDITDWLALRDGSLEELHEIVEQTPPVRSDEPLTDATAFTLQPHAAIPRREWLYAPAYIRGNVSVTAGAGGRSKSSLIIAEALAMVSGKALLDVPPPSQLRVWYMNLEDDTDELKRRFTAAATNYELTPAHIGERLFVDSGCVREIVLATEDFKRGAELNEAALEEIRRTIFRRNIDVVIFDPFVSLHRVSENDNGAIDLVVKALARLAQESRCAVMLAHHTRKPNGGEPGGVDDARGASSLTNAARYVRILNTMTAAEAQSLNIDEARRAFYFSATDGKTNLTPPAERRDWYQLKSVELGNGGAFEVEGDKVGVVTRFLVPATHEADRLRNLTAHDISAAFCVGGPWRAQGRSEMWAGYQLAAALGLGAETKPERDALQRAINLAVQRGWLVRFGAPDGHRESRPHVKLADFAALGTGAAEFQGAAE